MTAQHPQEAFEREPVRDTARRSDGPHAGALAIVSLGLTVAAVLASVVLGGGAAIPSPLGATADVARYYTMHPAAATANGFLVFASAVPLGIFAATVYARLLRLGVRVPGPGIAFFGGVAASVFVGMAGLVTWVTGQHVTAEPAALVHVLALLAYGLGGVGFVTGIGLLIAGIAVPALILRLIPRWLAWVGLAIALLSELSFLSLVLGPLSFTLPVGRFAGLLWLIIAGFLLPRTRHTVSAGR